MPQRKTRQGTAVVALALLLSSFLPGNGCNSMAQQPQELVFKVTATDRQGDAAAALEAALAQVRQARGRGATGPLAIEFAAGDYAFTRGVKLTAADAGTSTAPLLLRAAPGARVRFTGGRALTGLAPVTDAAVLARLPAAARTQVRQADLRTQGITDYGTFHARGFSRPLTPAMLELFWGGERLPLACWPATGFSRIAGIPADAGSDDGHGGKIGKLEAGFMYEGDRPGQWANVSDVIVHGYWAWDWANSYERIATLDPQTRHLRLVPPHGNYGYRPGQRIQFLNILEELGALGQWYLDRQAGRLYVWPPAAPANAEVVVSLLEAPFLKLDGAAHVTVAGLAFEYSRGTAIQITGGSDCRVEDCTFRNLGNYAVIATGGTAHAVRRCEISATGDGGVMVTGGDRRTLTPANHVVEDNHIHHVATWSKCYVPAVLGDGVGIRIAHNLIHDHPHCAILFGGNEFTIEYNEIHHVCLETGDVGAIYLGRDYTFRGNIVRYNYLHHTGGVGMGSMGVYNDDCVSGTTMVGNLFWKVQRAAFLGGGRDFRVENNVFVDCTPAVALDGRGLSKAPVWHDMVYQTMKERLEAMNWRQPPYSTRYPELAELVPFYAKDDGLPPGNILVARNICVGGQWTEIYWGATADMVTFADNLVNEDPQFVDAAKGDFRLQPTSPAFRHGFQALPLDQIGPRPKQQRP